MIEIGYFHSGTGSERKIASEKWEKWENWLVDFGLSESCTDSLAKREIRSWLDTFVKNNSAERKRKGVWELKAAYHPAREHGAGPKKRVKVNHVQQVYVLPECIEWAAKSDWDGEFEVHLKRGMMSTEEFGEMVDRVAYSGGMTKEQLRKVIEAVKGKVAQME